MPRSALIRTLLGAALGLAAGCGDSEKSADLDGSTPGEDGATGHDDGATGHDDGAAGHDDGSAGHADAASGDAALHGDVRHCSEPCDPPAQESCACDFDDVCGFEFDSSKDGQACSVEGQRCYWPDACSGPDCQCAENHEGELVWHCAVRLC